MGGGVQRPGTAPPPSEEPRVKAIVSWSDRISRVVSPSGGTASKQLYFTAFVLGMTVLIAISHPELVLAPPYLLALGVLATTTVLALVIDWDARPAAWSALVPVLDMVSVALMRDLMRDSSIAVSLLALIPVLWLAARVRMLGVVIAAAAVTVLITVPALLRAPHIDSLMIAHSLLLPFIVLQIGLLVVGALALLDGQRLQQAVGNLLSNALKYTSRGGTVLLRTCVSGTQAELNVIDSGMGMSDQEQTNLFTPYYRTRTARDSAITGHGIGLSLTRQIVVAHGAQISVRSRPGDGSAFTLHFSLDGMASAGA